MRSKTSFFNKAIYKKNMTLYWPIWVCYLLYGLIKIPGAFWSGIRKSVESGNNVMVTLFSCLSVEQDLYMLAAVAVITGIAMFGYLFSAKSTNMIHALPVNRTELYFTNVISGLTVILGPQILVFLISVVFCLLKGITCVQYLALWLFSMTAAGLFFYSLVCFCTMLTGLLAALPFWFVLLNYISVGVMEGIRYVLSFLGYGVYYPGVNPHSIGYMLSPLAYLTDIAGFRVNYTVDNRGQTMVTSAVFEGTAALLAYAAAALVLYALAWYGYQKRKLEHTGDLLAFGWVRPLFRWGIGAAIGFFTGIMISRFCGNVSLRISRPAVLILVLVMGIVGFFIADMLIQKSFRVFHVRRVKECAVFSLSISAAFALLYGAGYYEEQYIPDQDMVSYAYVNMNYPVEFQGKDMEQVVEIQKEILSNKKVFQSENRSENNCTSLYLSYCLKDGNIIERSYEIPCGTEAADQLAAEVFACEAKPDSFMKYVAGDDYDEITKLEEAQVECQSKNGNYVTLSMDEETAGKMYYAMLQDVREGTIQKYNLENYLEDAGGTTSQYPCAYLTVFFKHTSPGWKDVYSRYQDNVRTGTSQPRDNYEPVPDDDGSIYVKFGADCRNILKTLVEAGVISSEKDIVFSVEGEGTMG